MKGKYEGVIANLIKGIMMEITAKFETRIDVGLLEVLCRKWLELKWCAAYDGNLSAFSVGKLLGIESFVDQIPDSQLLRYLSKHFKPVGLPTIHRCNVKSSYSNVSSVLTYLKSIEIGSNRLAIILPSEGEAWDVCLKLQVSSTRHAYIFIDVKAMQEPRSLNAKKKKIDGRKMMIETCENYARSIHTGNMMNEGGLSDDYLYLYLTARDGETFLVDSSSALNTIVMAADTSHCFWGPLAHIDSVVRNIIVNQGKGPSDCAT
jgi:hypothetical protein